MKWPFRKRDKRNFVEFCAAWNNEIGGCDCTININASTKQALQMAAALPAAIIVDLPPHMHRDACLFFGAEVTHAIEQRKAKGR